MRGRYVGARDAPLFTQDTILHEPTWSVKYVRLLEAIKSTFPTICCRLPAFVRMCDARHEYGPVRHRGHARAYRAVTLGRRLRTHSPSLRLAPTARDNLQIDNICRVMSEPPTTQYSAQISRRCASGSASCTKANGLQLLKG